MGAADGMLLPDGKAVCCNGVDVYRDEPKLEIFANLPPVPVPV
jgi:hypothetical protein